jgi:hypothetical protein
MIMNDIRKAIEGLLGKIFLTKKVMFGLDENKIVIIVSPSLKIFELVARPAKALNNFPFEKNRYMESDRLKSWAQENGYEITFTSTIPTLNRRLMREFGDVMVEEVHSGKKELKVMVLEELEKSSLPESIKNWAKDNPEKFIQNIEEVQKLLKK